MYKRECLSFLCVHIINLVLICKVDEDEPKGAGLYISKTIATGPSPVLAIMPLRKQKDFDQSIENETYSMSCLDLSPVAIDLTHLELVSSSQSMACLESPSSALGASRIGSLPLIFDCAHFSPASSSKSTAHVAK